jgi:hypothetical protein
MMSCCCLVTCSHYLFYSVDSSLVLSYDVVWSRCEQYLTNGTPSDHQYIGKCGGEDSFTILKITIKWRWGPTFVPLMLCLHSKRPQYLLDRGLGGPPSVSALKNHSQWDLQTASRVTYQCLEHTTTFHELCTCCHLKVIWGTVILFV